MGSHLVRPSGRVAWLVSFALTLMLGCGDPTAPPDPALTGSWISWGIDSYAQFTLEKRGAEVSGTLDYGGFSGTQTSYSVRGVATVNQVMLAWKERDYFVKFEASLPTPNSSALTGRLTINGNAGPRVTYTRLSYIDPTAVSTH